MAALLRVAAAAALASTAAAWGEEIEHIIVFMQENRAYDHYYGTHQGVRGFNDRAAVPLRSGFNSLYQPVDQSDLSKYQLPFHTSTMSTSSICMPAPAMDYVHDMLIINEGRYDSWNTGRPAGMGQAFFNRSDLPYYYTLYESFVAGDQYFQSTFTCTDPNRLHLFSGSNGLSMGFLPVLDNTEPVPGWSWETMGETLENAGVSWKVYEQADNFDDNGFSWFASFQKAKPGSPLFDKGQARSADLMEDLRADLAAGKLPQVSWIVGPANVSEHATYHPSAGEAYMSTFIDIIKSFPDVYAKTAIVLNYDEGGQFVDHHWTPTPPSSTPADGMATMETQNEIVKVTGTPNGLGFRVPLLVVSPWTRGNIVLSEVFDHTSVVRLIERRFNVSCPNISPWRRAVCGDLTSAFDFAHPDFSWPALPDTSNYVKDAETECDTLPAPSVPATQSYTPQEPGTRVSRALPYTFLVSDALSAAAPYTFTVTINVTGAAGAPFLMLDAPNLATAAPRKFALNAGTGIVDVPQPLKPAGASKYALSLHGPNGFVRQFAGDAAQASAAGLSAALSYDAAGGNVVLQLAAGAGAAATFTVSDNAYGLAGSPWSVPVPAGGRVAFPVAVCGAAVGCWYDLSVSEAPTMAASGFQRRFMGRMETGADSISDPAMAAGVPANAGRPLTGLDRDMPRSADPAAHPEVPESHRSWPRTEGEDADHKWRANLETGAAWEL
jgi:phospholipase C